MKKLVLILFIIILVICVWPNNEDNVRVRVIANSNSEVDQNIKDEVVLILKKIIKCDDTIEDIEDKFDLLKDELNSYSKKKNIKIDLSFNKTKFPSKILDGKLIEGGIYQTLLITIGEGKGSNYWSLLYPEYYGITFEDVNSDNIIVKFYIYEKLKYLLN